MDILEKYLINLNEGSTIQKVKLLSKIVAASIFGLSVLGILGASIYGSLKDKKMRSDEDYRKCMVGCDKISIMINKLKQELKIKNKNNKDYDVYTDESYIKLYEIHENCCKKCFESYYKKMSEIKKEADEFKKKHKRG